MKTKLLLIFVILITFKLSAQDVVVLKHTNFTSHYSKSKKYPVMVEWWETTQKIACSKPLPRVDRFRPDPKLPNETDLGKDYLKSGFDRGHLMPAKSNQCQTPQIQDECFYFSNMAAQYHRLNAGDWKSLETLTREWATSKDSVHIWAGNVGELKKIGRVSVPTKCWKVVHIKKTNEWFFFLFNNDLSAPDGVNNNKVSREEIEKLTGLKFK
jgi:endonuclease G